MRIADPSTVVPFETIDLAPLSDGERQAEFLQRAAVLHASLDLQNGPLVRAALFDQGDAQPRYLLIIIHHLATDGVSWSVLLEDLQTLCKQLRAGERAALPPKTTSFKNWAERLVSHAQSDAMRGEASYWLSLSESSSARLPLDEQGANTAASAQTVSVALDADETRALLQEIPAALRTQINECTGCAGAGFEQLDRFATHASRSRRARPRRCFRRRRSITHGRLVHHDLSVVLDISDSQTPLDALRLVKEQLRAIPGRGLSMGCCVMPGATKHCRRVACADASRGQIQLPGPARSGPAGVRSDQAGY
jgi:hypothetical protein